ncbi:TonB-dependent receptor [Puia dinghuensis]|uniref:TonB-dependent receptor n=1 Tax=Puia dinghuensis TaxID=1792502 RepID=A0A8J2XWN2_9BACT|nr:TonB-dependent receptor [Puia dinghuensis]GGB21209.1 TonB-dependent receptor [Puia dinghuensis]
MRKILTLGLLLSCKLLFAQTLVKGRIVDRQTDQPLEDAVITYEKTNTVSDRLGNFELTIASPTDSLQITYIGYRAQTVAVPRSGNLLVALDQGAVDLKAVTIVPVSNNASFHTISGIDLRLRPLNSAQDLLRLVPGLFLMQHQGGGLAEHIFMRGFDADHGTDVSVAVDDMPVNLPSHAHGQGFSDLHFLIPELVTSYEYGKGPYYTDHGDFTTAGYVSFRTRDVLDKSEVKIEGGMFNTGRVFAMVNLLSDRAKQRGESAYIAGEVNYTDGPYDHPQNFSRGNLFGKYNVALSSRTRLKVTLSTFSSNWRSSGEIPQRAVDEGLISRWGAIDSAQGGYTSRTTAIARLTTTLSDKLLMEHQAYYSRYFFNEHYDQTFFANDSINGDQLRQRETRDLYGYNGRLTHHAYFTANKELTSAFGLGWQLNNIYGSELSHTKNYNYVLDYLQYGDVREMALNGYLDENYRVGNWLFNAGARLDYLYFDFRDKLNPQQPSRGKTVVSPKLNIAYTLNDRMQVYVKTGKGFHSNDAKVVVGNQGIDVLPSAYGADLGINWKPLPQLFVNAAVWYLYLQQEFVYSADDGTFNPGGKTRRQGIDLSARYQFSSWLFANFDINISNARDIEAAKGQNYLPLSVPLSSAGGLFFKLPGGLNGGISYRYMSNRPANPDNSIVAKGYFLTDVSAAYTRKRYEVGLEIQNVLNTKWQDAQYEINSQLRQEPAPVDDLSFTPGMPFFAKVKVAVFF